MRAPLQFVLDFLTGGDPEPLPSPQTVLSPNHPEGVPPQAPWPGVTSKLPPMVPPMVPPVVPPMVPPVVPPSPELRQPTGAVQPPAARPEGFHHPAANRQAVLQGVAVSFRLERSRRRTIGFMVGPDGLVVRSPSWVPLREVDAAVQEKSAWIVAKLQQARQRQTEQFQKAIEWAHGAAIPFLGRTVQLCVLERGVRPETLPEDSLPVSLPPGATTTQVREAAEAWLKKQARALFEQRLHHFAPLLGVRWQKMSLSSASTRWGSARSDGHIRLNWRLIHLPISQIDYVVVHELAHLREMNHSPRFWETVGEVMPDYVARRQALRQAPLSLAQD